MIKKLFIGLILSTSVALFGCSKKSNESNQNQTVNDNVQQTAQQNVSQNNNNKAPNFSLVDTKGKKISLSDFKGKVVIIDFWATWCPPCRRGIPDLIDLQKEYKGKLAIIGVSLDTDSKKDVVPFIKNYGINYPVVYGNAQIVGEYGNIQAIPTSFIIDKDGNIVNKHVGLVPKSKLKEEITSLMKNS